MQSNQRAELQAVLFVLLSESRDMDIRTDSQYVHDGATLHRESWRKIGWLHVDNGDLWAQVDKALLDRPLGSVIFT